MSGAAWSADPLIWGEGQRRFEVFLEPTCPFSARAFAKLWAFLELAGADRVSLRIHLQSQPWHLYSGVITRAILAASTMAGGKESARKIMQAVFDRRAEFEFDNHCTGPNRDATPNDILARIEASSGIDVRAAFDIPDLDRAIKWHSKYARQNGIHVSPTFMVDGLVAANLGSGDAIEAWRDAVLA